MDNQIYDLLISSAFCFEYYSLREIFPEGLPPSYVFVATLRMKTARNQATFDLWRVISKDGVTQAAVTLRGRERNVVFTTTGITSEEQAVIFNNWGLKVSDIDL